MTEAVISGITSLSDVYGVIQLAFVERFGG